MRSITSREFPLDLNQAMPNAMPRTIPTMPTTRFRLNSSVGTKGVALVARLTEEGQHFTVVCFRELGEPPFEDLAPGSEARITGTLKGIVGSAVVMEYGTLRKSPLRGGPTLGPQESVFLHLTTQPARNVKTPVFFLIGLRSPFDKVHKSRVVRPRSRQGFLSGHP
jgi:hypothetical protein